MVSCAISTCTNTSRNQISRNFSFHRFPTNKSVRRVWVIKCKRKDKINKNKAVICSVHFCESDFEEDTINKTLGLKQRIILKSSAIPTLQLPLQKIEIGITERDKRLQDRKALPQKRNSRRKQHKECQTIQDDLDRKNSSCQTDPNGKMLKDSDCQTESPENRSIFCQTEGTGQVSLLSSIAILKAENRKLSAIISTLKKRIVQNKKVVKNKQHNSHEIYSPRVSQVAQKNIQEMFSPAQLKIISGNKKVNWTCEDIAKSLAIASVSKSAYETIRTNWKIPLPNQRTLRSWMSKYPCKQGFLSEIIILMKEEAKSLDNFHRLTILNFDEMNIRSTIEYDISTDTIVGPNKNAQVIISNGICSKWRQPIFYEFDQKITPALLNNAITTMESSNFIVSAIVSDFGGTNRELWKKLEVSSTKSYITNPTRPDSRIWFFADAPHMLKLLRNHLLDHGWVLPNGVVVDKGILEQLIIYDSSELKLCPKLTRQIIDVTGSERMRVSPAAKVFSHHTATLAKFCFPNLPEIGEFFQTINDYFDIFNSRIPKDSDNVLKSAYGMCQSVQNKRLTEIETYIKSIRSRFYSKKLMKMVTRSGLLPCQHGILASISSLRGMLEDLNKEFDVTYIMTRRLNQDPLESLFSIIRSLGRTNDNPTPVQFKNRMKTILLGSKLKSPIGSNVKPDEDDSYYVSGKLFEFVKTENKSNTKLKDMIGDSVEDVDPAYCTSLELKDGDVSSAALKYLAGYLAFVLRLKYKLKYGDYSKDVVRSKGFHLDRSNISEAWTIELSRGGLMIPSEKITSWCINAEIVFLNFFQNIEAKNLIGVKVSLQRLMKTKHPEMISVFVREFIKIRLKIRINMLNLQKNKIIHFNNS